MKRYSARLLLILVLLSLPRTPGVPVESLWAWASPSQTVDEKVELLTGEAQKDIERGDYSAALRNYQQVAALRPDSAAALSNLGVAYHLLGRPGEAVTQLRKALKIDPTMVPANLVLGIDCVQLGQPAEAIAPLRRSWQTRLIITTPSWH